jgi:cation:H+ antiporter
MPILAVVGGLWILIWSSDRFVGGAAATARFFGISPLVIGMVIVGFGTSAPEMVVSAFSALNGNPALALGNAYGSNIANIALILGITALILPIQVQSKILRREIPLLTGITLISFFMIQDLELSRMDGLMLLVLFVLAIGATLWMAMKGPVDAMIEDVKEELPGKGMSRGKAFTDLILGLVLLMASSRLLVWGAVELALLAKVSELVIGLTVVAIGTSLPELASTIAAVRKGEHDMAIGNVVGSNLFNTLAVVGIAAGIRPFRLEPEILYRDFPVMGVLTLSLFFIGRSRKGPGRITRWEGAGLVTVFLGYTGWLLAGVIRAQ